MQTRAPAQRWQSLALQNGATQADSSVYNLMGYFKNHYGIVCLRGRFNHPTSGSALLVATLPVGYRPRAFRTVDLWHFTPRVILSFFANGEIIASTFIAGAAWGGSLDGISFMVAEP